MSGPALRVRLRRLGFGLATLLGGRPRGFFLPYRYADDALPPPGYPELEPLFRAAEAAFAGVLDAIDGHAEALLAIGAAPPPAPRWAQDWFPRLDAAAAYAIVRRHRPARIVEIGSGHSTRFLARAVADGGLATKIVAVDPAPRARIAHLPAQLPVDVRRSTLRDALAADGTDAHGTDAEDGAVFRFAADDVLFIDSSHLLMPGSDVDLILNRLVPRLPTGSLLHVHDVFLPERYPPDWAWRGYNEQNALAPLLVSGAFEIVFASRWTVRRMEARLRRSVVDRLPLPEGAFETSLWLRRR